MKEKCPTKYFCEEKSGIKYWLEPSARNTAACKKHINECLKERRKIIKSYMDKISGKGIGNFKNF